jgi:hypothetical protein
MALEQGHSLTLYVRNPDKVPAEIKDNPKVTVIKGSLDDESGLEKAVNSGPTVFVSFAGPTFGSKGTVRLSRVSFLGMCGFSSRAKTDTPSICSLLPTP